MHSKSRLLLALVEGHRRSVTWLLFGLLLFGYLSATAQTVSPFMGLGYAQFFDNNGKPLTAGVLYSFQAGTSTQQATYTDSTGLIPNPNPIPFGSGARVQIWLSSGAFYKFVLCSQNDGPACAPADTLFSVDQVPGIPGATVGGNTFTGTFISGSANPATTGILRLASADTICWRNAANSANLCISKDTSDVLSWAGNAMKFLEGGCSNSALGFDYLCADSSAHRWKMANNGGSQLQIVAAGVDVNSSDQVTQVHFGSTPTPFSNTAPGTNQYLQWNGTQFVGNTPTFTQSPSVVSNTYKPLSSDVAVSATTVTTVMTQAVTMPSSGCPCRALVAWTMGSTTSNALGSEGWINDGTNNFATGGMNTTGGVGPSTRFYSHAASFSTGTYSNNAVITFTLKIEAEQAMQVKSAAEFSPQNSTWMNITIFTSN